MSYQLIKQTKGNTKILHCGSKYNLLNDMEGIIFNFLLVNENEKRANLKPLRNPSHLNSRTFNNYPCGFFCCYDSNNYDKLIVYKKTKGYFWNDVFNVFSLEVVKNIDYEKIRKKRKIHYFGTPETCERFHQVLEELLIQLENSIKELGGSTK